MSLSSEAYRQALTTSNKALDFLGSLPPIFSQRWGAAFCGMAWRVFRLSKTISGPSIHLNGCQQIRITAISENSGQSPRKNS